VTRDSVRFVDTRGPTTAIARLLMLVSDTGQIMCQARPDFICPQQEPGHGKALSAAAPYRALTVPGDGITVPTA